MVYVVLINFNNTKDTIECLKSLISIDNVVIKIFVVDNHSSIEQVLLLKEYIDRFPNLKLIENSINGGFASGCNLAIKEILKKDEWGYIWLLNNDAIVNSLTLYNMVNVMEVNAKVGVCGSKIMDFNNKQKIQSIGGSLNRFFSTTSHIQNTNTIKEPDYIVGASMLIRKACIEQVGLMSEDYFLYYEDVDYSMRVKEHGFSIAVCLDSIVYHKEGCSTMPSGIKSEFIDLLQIQNRKVFARKFNLNRLGVFLGILIAAFNRLRRGHVIRFIKVFSLAFRDYTCKQVQLK